METYLWTIAWLIGVPSAAGLGIGTMIYIIRKINNIKSLGKEKLFSDWRP